MASEVNTTTDTVADAATKQTDAAAKAVGTAARSGERTVKKAAATQRKAAAKAQRRAKPRRATTRKTNAGKARAARSERKIEMNFDPKNAFAGFGAFPGVTGFETLVGEVTARGEQAAKRSRKAAEELAEITRGNIEAVVEAGRIASNGAQSISRKAIAKGRDNVELAANTVRSMADAKNPADLLQLQAEFVRGAFDRFVEDSSALTESVVKLAGEAFQPISTRATRNVERINDLVA